MSSPSALFPVALLRSIPTVGVTATLHRAVPGIVLPILFVSGKANRYNPTGVRCLYCSATKETARVEASRMFAVTTETPWSDCPIRVGLSRVLDLCDAETRRRLGITTRDLRAPWRGSRARTRTQILGAQIDRLARRPGGAPLIVAVRYPSVTCQGETNYALFADAIVGVGDTCEVLGLDADLARTWFGPRDFLPKWSPRRRRIVLAPANATI